MAAARTDIDTSWGLFSRGERALAKVDRAAIALEPDLERLDLKDFGTLLAASSIGSAALFHHTGRFGMRSCGRSTSLLSAMATLIVSRSIFTRSRKR